MFAGKEMFNLSYPANTPFLSGKVASPPTVEDQQSINKTVVYTILFQTFVFMQIFNQINCRKLGQELNIFKDFFNNWLFIAIMIFTFGVQMILVQFGGIAVRCYPLTWAQQGICFAIGAGGIVWGFLVKVIIRPSYFGGIKINESPVTLAEAESSTSVMILRKNSTK